MAAFLQAHEPEDRFLNGLADGKEAMVLQKSGLLVAEAGCNVLSLLLDKDNAVEGFVQDVVLAGTVSLPRPIQSWESGAIHCGRHTSPA